MAHDGQRRQGGFAWVYEVHSGDGHEAEAAKVVSKASLTKSKAREKVRVTCRGGRMANR